MGYVEGSGIYEEGAIATLKAIPNTGYIFDYWIVNDEMMTDNPLVLTVMNDINVEAMFKSPVTTGFENLKGNHVEVEKVLRDGRVYIRVDGQLYTLTGASVQ